MATYKKPNKVLQGSTIMGVMFSATDENGKRDGSYAIDAFEGKKIIKAKVEDADALIPFHAVSMAMYATATENLIKFDPYGCEDSNVTITYYKTDRTTVWKTETYQMGETVTLLYPTSQSEITDIGCSSSALGVHWEDSDGHQVHSNFVAESDMSLYPACFA